MSTLPPAQTFSSMLSTLRSRCGLHATLGNAPALNDILTEANDYVYDQLDDGLPMTSIITLSADVAEYPWDSDEAEPIARGSVQTVWIEQGDSERVPLPQGINHAMRADQSLRAIPQRYDSRFVDGIFSLEVWPIPDQTYRLFIDHNRVLTRFTQPTDKPSCPSRLVLGYAVALGKAHYGKADADTAGQSFKTMLYKAKVKQKENRRYLPPTACDPGRPRVVATANGFRQVG
ncbi:hypothetical protein [Hydrogenophaga sp. 2FB]|uniref:hypothetical protein n=1 Tax=Hydrogenophaga sp. 2FB TaxID=2502187 RepID=UPI0010F7DC44|nr:hypothetical protein [Hydrogenophaga sp. 2FB]